MGAAAAGAGLRGVARGGYTTLRPADRRGAGRGPLAVRPAGHRRGGLAGRGSGARQRDAGTPVRQGHLGPGRGRPAAPRPRGLARPSGLTDNDPEHRMTDSSARRRVVIIGGGFAGLFAARRLGRAPVQVTLIDRAEHHLFQPLLYQCATGILSEGKIAAPLRELLSKHRNVEFQLAQVTGIDAAARKVTVRRPLGEEIEFGYDYLILAAGVRQSYFGHDEYAAFAPGMKSIEDALKIRRL